MLDHASLDGTIRDVTKQSQAGVAGATNYRDSVEASFGPMRPSEVLISTIGSFLRLGFGSVAALWLKISTMLTIVSLKNFTTPSRISASRPASAARLVVHGHAIYRTGSKQEGLQEIVDGMSEWESSGSRLNWVSFQAMLAEVHLWNAEYKECFRALDEGFRFAEYSGEKYYEAELYRIRGEVLSRMNGKRDLRKAEESFRTALTLARRQKAQAIALRSGRSLAHLLTSQRQIDQARRVLEEVCAHAPHDCAEVEVLRARQELSELGGL